MKFECCCTVSPEGRTDRRGCDLHGNASRFAMHEPRGTWARPDANINATDNAPPPARFPPKGPVVAADVKFVASKRIHFPNVRKIRSDEPKVLRDEIHRRDARIVELEEALKFLGSAITIGSSDDILLATRKAGEVIRKDW